MAWTKAKAVVVAGVAVGKDTKQKPTQNNL